MSDGRSERPSDGDGLLPPVGARTPGLDDLSDPPSRRRRETSSSGAGSDVDRDTAWEGEWDEPNYLVRRAIAIGVGLVVVAAVAWVVVGFIGGDDDSGSASLPSNDWDTVVVLTADEIRTLDPGSGELIDTFEASDDLFDAQSLVSGNVLVTMNDVGRITQTDLTDGSTTRGRAGLDHSLLRSGDNPTIALAGADIGGDVIIIDTPTRRTLSVGDVAGLDDPLIFADTVLVNASGSHAAVSDARSFQSIVVDITTEAAELIAGQVVGINDDLVVTAQRAGDNTELEFYDLIGDRLGSVDVVTPAAAMLTESGRMLLVDPTGIIRLAGPDGNVDDVGVIADPTDPTGTIEVETGTPLLGGSRLAVTTTRHVVVLDDDGGQVAFTTGSLQSTATRNHRCVAVGTTSVSAPKLLLDVDDGTTVAEITGTVSASSADGCSVALIGSDPSQIVIDREITDVDADSVDGIAPDGGSYVVVDGRDLELIDGDDNTELADEPALVRFARRE